MCVFVLCHSRVSIPTAGEMGSCNLVLLGELSPLEEQWDSQLLRPLSSPQLTVCFNRVTRLNCWE